MSCWQRPDWAEFFDCAGDHVTEPVYIWFPVGLTYLVAFALGGALGWWGAVFLRRREGL